MTSEATPLMESLHEIRQTEDRGRAVFATQCIPIGTTIHLAVDPFVCVIKGQFRKEVCAWCFAYQHGKKCPIKRENVNSGLAFCSKSCLNIWMERDLDSALTEALASLRNETARAVQHASMVKLTKQYTASMEEFPLDLAILVASAIVERTREMDHPCRAFLTWEDVLDLQSGVTSPEIDLPSEIEQIVPFLKRYLPRNLVPLIESTAYPFLSRHLSNSFGIWELPIGPDSENLGFAMYPSASYFNHACDSNVKKVRQGRSISFVASRDIEEGEELCISYGYTERDVMERRRNLQEWWGFTCSCDRCLRELKYLEKDKSAEGRCLSR